MADTEGKRPMKITLPPGMASGVYADFVAVWHSRDVFTLDFVSLSGPTGNTDLQAGPGATRQAEIAARVRIPPSQVFEMMKALETQLSAWERETGKQKPPAADS